jgi:hypothetical protein
MIRKYSLQQDFSVEKQYHLKVDVAISLLKKNIFKLGEVYLNLPQHTLQCQYRKSSKTIRRKKEQYVRQSINHGYLRNVTGLHLWMKCLSIL